MEPSVDDHHPAASPSIPGTWIEEVFDRTPLGILQLGAAWEVRYANRVAAEICGVTDWRHMRFGDLFQDEAARAVLAREQQAREQGHTGEYEVTITRPDSHAPVRVSITGTPIMTHDGTFAGSVVILRSLELESISRELDQRIAQAKDSQEALKIVAEKLREIIGFDAFAASVFSEDVGHALVLLEDPEGFLPGRRRWYPVSAPTREIFRDDRPAHVRLADVFQRTGSEVLGRMIEDGLQWMMRCPVVSEGRAAGTIGLFTKNPAGFTQAEFDVFSRLPLSKAFIAALLLRSREKLEFRYDLVKDIAACETDQELFDRFIEHLRKYYGWSHISVFMVDKIAKRIVLQSQIGDAPVPADHSQSTEDGILGRVFRTGEDENVGDVRAPNYAGIVYFAEHRPDLTSELCMGIKSEGEIYALLNVEDSHKDAFSRDEQKTMRELLDDVGAIIDRRRKDNLARALVQATPTAVFLVDGGMIRWANPAAGQMLELPAEKLAGTSIADYVIDAKAGEALAQSSQPGGELRIKTHTGKEVPVQVGGAVLEAAAHRRLIVLRDLSFSNSRELRGQAAAMLADLARLANTPLSLLSLGLREIRSRVAVRQGEGLLSRFLAPPAADGEAVLKLIDRSAAQLRRVELAYGEVQLYDTENSALAYREVEISLEKFLRGVIGELPLSQQHRVRGPSYDGLPPSIRGDVFQLTFAIQTIVAQFFLLGTSADEVVFDVVAGPGEVSFGFSRVSPFTDDELQSTESLEAARARAGLSLAEGIIRRFAENHGGVFAEPVITPGGRLVVGFSVPLRAGFALHHA